MPKNNRKRGETALSKNRGSGFEDGYADPPITPGEFIVERQMYSKHNPFHERIEECIQRFKDRRRMPQERAVLFDKYLALGGVDTSQRQFTGTANYIKDWKSEGYTADEIRGMAANDFLSRDDDPNGKFYNPEFPEHWDVDFAGVVAGYLGSYLPEQGGVDSRELCLAADIILNFLKYVRHHDVCPEYSENLNEAIRICEVSATEMSQVGAVARVMPGDFNLACRILFCTTGKPRGSADPSTDEYVIYEDKSTTEYGEMIKIPDTFDTVVLAPASLDPELVFKTTIALHEPDCIGRVNDVNESIHIVNAFSDDYEVKKIVFADTELVGVYEGVTQHDGSLRTVGAVGQVIMFPTIIEDGWEDSPTLEKGRDAHPGKPISLYMDHEVLTELREGMKLSLTICELSIGVGFVKEVAAVLPAFHVFLPQTLMMQWKTPRLNERPPPSVDDPGAAERYEQEGLEKDEEDALKEQRKADPALDKEMRELEDAEALEKAMEQAWI